MIFKDRPVGFNKEIDVAACYIEHEGRFVMLHRQPHKTSGNQWGLPAGKVDPGETFHQAMAREIEEETGLALSEDELDYFGSLYVRNEGRDIHYHMFSTSLAMKPEITIRPEEHQDFAWVSPEEALAMDLVHDLDECIRLFYNDSADSFPQRSV